MADWAIEADLAALRVRRSERSGIAPSDALRRHVPSDDPRTVRDERLEDHTRPSEVAAAWKVAAGAPVGPEGEGPRRWFRLLAWPFLDRAVAEQRSELDACRARLDWPERGFEFEIATNPSPECRRRLHERWFEAESRLAELRSQCTLAAVEAAQSSGAASLCEFRAAGHPADVESVCARYEASAIAPLDEAIERASRARRLRSPWTLSEPEHPADSPVAETLAGYADRFPAAGIPAVLRVLGAALGMDPDGSGPGVIHDPDACFRPRAWVTRSRPLVLIGAMQGPVALAAALDAFGRLARHAFLSGIGGPVSALAADPAFEIAAGTLFGRLLRSEIFRARFGPRPDEAMDADLRLEAALPPRLAWTYLYLALRGRHDEAEAGRVMRRALGRPATVGQQIVSRACDPQGAARLRGTVLALLLEERLLSRWGREWFGTGQAGRFLRECWEAEAGQTAEGVANVLDLGTIEPTPILDGCRP